jgi:trimethylamine---corrinoid protein Co-methyltransferase
MYGVVPLKGRMVEVLSNEEVMQIHQAALDVMRDVGVKIEHEEALDIFKRAGAEIDQAKQIAHIPQLLVEYALNHAPRFMTVCGKDSQYDLKSGTGAVHFSSGHGATFVYDFETGERRPATKKDLENEVRLHDALANTHLVYPGIYPQDVPPQALDRHISQALLTNTDKPVVAVAYNGKGAKDLLRMGVAIAGSEEALHQRPTFTVSLGVVSPLLFEHDRVDVLLEICRSGHPFQIYTIPSTGGTSPVTLAGTLVLTVAELLAGLVLTQLVRPGTPVRLMAYPSIIDQRFGSFTFACPEATLMAGAMAQLFRYYGVPHAVHGATTRANVLDAQAGYETGILDMFSALSGSEVVIECTSAGLEDTVVSCYEQAVIGNEITDMIYRILRGIDVNPETLALDVIKEIGPAGQYMTHSHTLTHFKSENWDAKLGNRMTRDEWKEMGGLDIRAKAREEVKRILATHHPKPLDANVQRKLQKIVEEAEK